MIQEITKVFVDLGVPEYDVEVIVHEIPKILQITNLILCYEILSCISKTCQILLPLYNK